MSEEQFDRELKFQVSMALVDEMLEKGIIGQEDYEKWLRHMTQNITRLSVALYQRRARNRLTLLAFRVSNIDRKEVEMAKIVRKIEAAAPAPVKLKRVAAYARVSMETERLNHSLSAQVSYYSELIQKHPGWVYAGVYADDGISGTKVNRPEFQKMLAECEAGNIDIVLTKSISRFARNTVDLLETVRHLKELGIEVQFERAHQLSERRRRADAFFIGLFCPGRKPEHFGQRQMGPAKAHGARHPPGHFRVYGYHWDGDTLVPTPEEAVIVKRIFQNFLDGKSRLETEREFAAEGITTRDGCRWVDSNIKSVLCNVTYTGNLLLQKEFTADPISKKKKKNRGELPQYFVPNTHEAIIDKETFDYVQSEMARRRELGPLANKALNTSFLTGKIKCAFCGQSYMHSQRLNRAKRTLQPEKMETWACGSRKRRADDASERRSHTGSSCRKPPAQWALKHLMSRPLPSGSTISR